MATSNSNRLIHKPKVFPVWLTKASELVSRQKVLQAIPASPKFPQPAVPRSTQKQEYVRPNKKNKKNPEQVLITRKANGGARTNTNTRNLPHLERETGIQKPCNSIQVPPHYEAEDPLDCGRLHRREEKGMVGKLRKQQRVPGSEMG